jgi:DNA repair exonuclease SbcCD ATPase subunit
MKRIFSMFVFILLLVPTIAIAQEEELPDAGTTPDSILYGLDKAFESISLALTFNKAAKAEKRLQMASERLSELKVMTDKGKPEYFDDLADEYDNNIRAANEIATTAKLLREDKSKLTELVALATSKHLSVLDKVEEKVPEQAKEAITKAKETSMNGQKNALKALSEDKPEKAAEINLNAAKGRLNRAKEKAATGESGDVEEALEEYAQMTDLSKELAEKDAEAAEDIAADFNEQIADLDEIEDKAPEDVKEKIKEKKSSSLEKQRNTLRSLAKDKPEKAAEIHSKAAEARLNRAKEKAEENEVEEVEDEIEEFEKLANFGNEISQIAQGLGKDTTTVDQLVAKATTRHLDVLAEVYAKVPDQAKAAIESAMAKSTIAREKSVEALKNKGALGNIPEEVPTSVSDKISDDVKERVGIKGKPEMTGKP